LNKDKKAKLRKILVGLDPDSKPDVLAAELNEKIDELKGSIKDPKDFTENIETLRDAIVTLHKNFLDKIKGFVGQDALERLRLELESKIPVFEQYNDTELRELIKKEADELEEKLKKLRIEALSRGGAMNQQINVNSSVMSVKYADINLVQGSNILLSKSDDNVNKRVNITVSASVVGGVPGGADTNIQFNDGGAFGGSSVLTFNKNSSVLLSAGEVVISPIVSSLASLTVVATANNNNINLRAAFDEGGNSIEFWKHPTSNDPNDRIGQFTGHGSAVGSFVDEMAWYTTNNTGFMTNRLKLLANIVSTPLILTGATGIARTSGQTIRIGEDFGDGTNKTIHYDNVGIFTPASPIYPLEITPTLTNVTSSLVTAVGVATTIAPSISSEADFYGIFVKNTANPASTISLATITGAYLENRLNSDFASSVTGLLIRPVVTDDSAPLHSSVQTVIGIDLRLHARTSGTTILDAGTGYGINTSSIFSNGGSTWNNVTQINLADTTINTISSFLGIDIAGLTRGSSTNIGLRIGKSTTYSLQLSDTSSVASGGITFGTDTNLYRNGINSLKTDDNFVAANVVAGVYSPTSSILANLDGTPSASEAQYLRVGNTVTVSGRVTMNPTLTATATSFDLTLPVATNLGAAEDCAGTAFCGAIAGMGAEVIGSAANDKAVVQFIASDVNSNTLSYNYSYQVI